MSPVEIKCPRCKSTLKRHPTLIGFDVGFYRCDGCKKNWAEPGDLISQLGDWLLGRKTQLEEVNDKGARVAPTR